MTTTIPHNGTDTSRAAAGRHASKAQQDRMLVLNAFIKAWNERKDGYTDEEGGRVTGLKDNTYRPRRWDLAGGSKERPKPVHLEDRGVRRLTESGNEAIVWFWAHGRV